MNSYKQDRVMKCLFVAFVLSCTCLFAQTPFKVRSYAEFHTGKIFFELRCAVTSEQDSNLVGAQIAVYELIDRLKAAYVITSKGKEMAPRRKIFTHPENDTLVKRLIGKVFTNAKGKFSFTLDFDKEYVISISQPSFLKSNVLIQTVLQEKATKNALYECVAKLKAYTPGVIGEDPGTIERVLNYDLQNRKFQLVQNKTEQNTLVAQDNANKEKKSIAKELANQNKETKAEKGRAKTKLIADKDGVSAEIIGIDTVNKIDIAAQKQGKWMYNGKYASDNIYTDTSRYYEGIYSDNIKNGSWKKFYPNDTIWLDLLYKDNELSGDYKLFYQDGKLKSKGVWDKSSNKFKGPFQYFYPGGQIYQDFKYDSTGAKSGTQMIYYNNGNPALIATIKNGVPEGTVLLFAEDGGLSVKKMYKNGQLIDEIHYPTKSKFDKTAEDSLMRLLLIPDTLVTNQLKQALLELDELEKKYGSILTERDEQLKQAGFLISEKDRELLLKQKRLSRLELEKAVVELELQRKKAWLYTGTLILALLLVITTIVLKNNREKQKTNVLLKQQKDEIETQNKEIKDSIAYARRIQQAILPPIEKINKALSNSFVIYMPKDIVSGDFYWFDEVDGCKIIIAADCTGHGVPGALMSMMGNDLLNHIILEKRITDPAKILSLLNQNIKTSLKPQQDQTETLDGMDIAICSIKGSSMTYAGAHRPLWMIGTVEGEYQVEEIKADKTAMGGYTAYDYSFSNHVLEFKKDTNFYIFSDGFADQFNEAGKKMMTKRLKQTLCSIQQLSFTQQKEHLTTFFNTWKGKIEQTDDVLIIGFRA